MTDRGSDLVFVVGSTAAVSNSVLSQLAAYVPGGEIYHNRFFGADRYATSADIADAFGPWDTIGLASGANFPDALSGGAAVGRYAGALVLTTPTTLHPAARDVIEANAPYSIDLEAFGSTAALSAGTFTSAINALGTTFYDIDDPSGFISIASVAPLDNFLRKADSFKPAAVRLASILHEAIEICA